MYEHEPVILELFAVMCIAASHYVSYVNYGKGDNGICHHLKVEKQTRLVLKL